MKKKLVVCILCGMMAMSALTCGIGSVFAAESPETPVISAQEGEQIPNPWKEYTSVKDAENAVGFSVKLPKKISGYTKDMIQAVDGLVLQVFYKSGAMLVPGKKPAQRVCTSIWGYGISMPALSKASRTCSIRSKFRGQ